MPKLLYKIITKLQRMYWCGYYRTLAFQKCGRNTVIDNRVSFRGAEYIQLGCDVYLGKDSTIECFASYAGEKYTPQCTIADGVSVTRRLTVYCAQKVTIGENAMIGSDVLITDENHGIEDVGDYRNNPLTTNPVIIEENVWIGDKAVILPGVTIGKACVIGAGSVVTKSIPPYSMAAGNPARVLKVYNVEAGRWERISEEAEV